MQTIITDHHMQLQDIWSHMDDMEDCQRRNNICLRGVPDAIGQEALLPMAKEVFNTLLGNPATDHIQIDRIHCIPGALNPAITSNKRYAM